MLNATSTQNDNKLYSLAALFIYGNNQEITKQKIADVLKVLGIVSQSKLAELFECDLITMKSMLCSTTSSNKDQSSNVVVEEKKKEETPKEVVKDEPIADIGIDFDDFF